MEIEGNLMSRKVNLPDRIICFLYKELLFPLENGLRKCNFPNFDLIDPKLLLELKIEPAKNCDQMFMLENNWKNRKDQYLVFSKCRTKKSMTLIIGLRNAFAHGDMAMCQRAKIRMLKIRHEYNGDLLIFGQVTEDALRSMILSIVKNTSY